MSTREYWQIVDEHFGIRLPVYTVRLDRPMRAKKVLHDGYSTFVLTENGRLYSTFSKPKYGVRRVDMGTARVIEAAITLGVIPKGKTDQAIAAMKEARASRERGEFAAQMIAGAEEAGIQLTSAQKRKARNLIKLAP